MLRYQANLESRTIRKCQPHKATETHLIFNDIRMPKQSEWYAFFDDFAQAKAWLLLEVESKKTWHYQQIEVIDRQLQVIKGMEEK